jgi:hypothetical protein
VCKREEASNSGLISFMGSIGRRLFVTTVTIWLLQILFYSHINQQSEYEVFSKLLCWLGV